MDQFFAACHCWNDGKWHSSCAAMHSSRACVLVVRFSLVLWMASGKLKDPAFLQAGCDTTRGTTEVIYRNVFDGSGSAPGLNDVDSTMCFQH